jgi:predicted SAM-dependent methyltransferase
MPLDRIQFKNYSYPKFQGCGNAAQFAIPYAQNVLYGDKIDIGCNREDWKYPGAIAVDPVLNQYDAFNLPHNRNSKTGEWDGIFSSHCLEHINDWVKALELWHAFLKPGGILFLYLPDCENQVYWRPWHNRKHVNYMTPAIIGQYFSDMSDMWDDFVVSEVDLNCSFMSYASKK